jgi:hypothetical protein
MRRIMRTGFLDWPTKYQAVAIWMEGLALIAGSHADAYPRPGQIHRDNVNIVLFLISYY